uniref:kelch domain-containing protein 2 n=1 Tax=Pristiophorus japonicus TaxID=55135 RepID=UPI00398EAB46
MANENEGVNEDLHVVEEEEEDENALDYHQDRMPLPTFHDSVPEERSGHIAVAHGSYMYILGGYKNAAIRGYHDFYLPREELWIYNMETGRWKKKYTEGDVPQSMSGSCAACVDGVLYLFGGHHARGNTNEVVALHLLSRNPIVTNRRPNKEISQRRPKNTLFKKVIEDFVAAIYTNAILFIFRLWHSACTSDEAEVIVFGGCANNLLARQQAAHSNDILVFSIQPKSLVRLCLEAVIHYKEMLANIWDCLPKHLLLNINQRAGSSNTSGS